MLRVLSDGAMFCYIQDVFVFEYYRGQGLGRALLEQAMCSMEELLEVSGVGDKKAARYGKAFLRAIEEYEDER